MKSSVSQEDNDNWVQAVNYLRFGGGESAIVCGVNTHTWFASPSILFFFRTYSAWTGQGPSGRYILLCFVRHINRTPPVFYQHRACARLTPDVPHFPPMLTGTFLCSSNTACDLIYSKICSFRRCGCAYYQNSTSCCSGWR